MIKAIRNLKRFSKSTGQSTAKIDILDLENLYKNDSLQFRSILFRMRVPICDHDDLIQESFLKAWTARNNFVRDAQPKSWMTRIIINTAIDYLRARKDVINIDSIEIETKADSISLETKQIAEKALEELPLTLRSTYVLHRLEGFNQAETAKILEVPIGTIKSRIHEAQKKIKEYLTKQGLEKL